MFTVSLGARLAYRPLLHRQTWTMLGLSMVALASAWFCTPARATSLFGSLSNFDVVNDTGEICHGFEIELEGVHPEDISFTFGAPYIRYGDPTIISTGTGAVVRYASAFDGTNWAVGTPVPAGPFPTGGHECFYPAYGGDPNYETLGGEHFGLALNGNPTNTTYRWLLGDNSGNLIQADTNVKVPAPIWNVQPAANPNAPAAVQAVIPALPIENHAWEFGEAMWVKVFVTESEVPAELNQLLPGNPHVPDGSDAAEVEIEWQLLQAGNSDGLDEVDSGLNDLGNNSESITRRYEFYKYIGGYDPENHEALVDDAGQHPEAVGEFIGAQNAALNLAAFAAGLPGDFNRDSIVDAADYIVWRQGLDTNYTQDDYDVWRANFGQTAGGGAALPSAEPPSAAVPEPAALVPLMFAVSAWFLGRGRKIKTVSRNRQHVAPLRNISS